MAKDPRLNKNRPMPLPMPYLKEGRLVIIQEMLDTINKDLGNCEENIDEKLDKIEKTMNEKLDKIEERILFLVNVLI